MSNVEDLCLVQDLMMKAEHSLIFLIRGLTCWSHFDRNKEGSQSKQDPFCCRRWSVKKGEV
jgi:hypothetical protein